MNTPLPDSERPADHQRWLEQAFAFVAGELEGEALERFERDLDQYQAAREAVAEMVELTQAIAVVEYTVASQFDPVPVHSAAARRATTRSWTRAMGWMAVGAAASLLAILVVGPWSSDLARQDKSPEFRRTSSSERSAGPFGSTPELALAWSRTRQYDRAAPPLVDLPEVGEGDDVEALGEDFAGEQLAGDASPSEPGRGEEAPPATPSWIIAAVSAAADEGVPSVPATVPDRKEL